MMVEQRLFKKGDFVELVDLSQFGPLEVPMPQRWFILRTRPSREFRVIKTFRDRNISAYLPTVIRTVARDTRKVSRKPHLGRRVIEPLFHGLIFIPDFECVFDKRASLPKGWLSSEREASPMVSCARAMAVDGVDGFLRFDDWTAFVNAQEIARVRALEHLSTVPLSQRKRLYEIGQCVRIVDGPLVGFEGVIDRLDSKGRLRVFIDALKRGARVSITEAQIEPALASTDA